MLPYPRVKAVYRKTRKKVAQTPDPLDFSKHEVAQVRYQKKTKKE
jgi:hypothetical protein